ncbi:hypothetical protein I316_00617 [Kwoniella heveanensis BCC8398]|uniref:Uncharacterized protein n=1 Tax=Kwoniella heveanensis BCC8398 TaxID=1296120 RepID=A0A1B9H2J4_9TREE|nr:hypothetical protein I316_00617 [Kwoniella heveanensis BCC8398]
MYIYSFSPWAFDARPALGQRDEPNDVELWQEMRGTIGLIQKAKGEKQKAKKLTRLIRCRRPRETEELKEELSYPVCINVAPVAAKDHGYVFSWSCIVEWVRQQSLLYLRPHDVATDVPEVEANCPLCRAVIEANHASTPVSGMVKTPERWLKLQWQTS